MPATTEPPSIKEDVPARFRVAKGTLIFDRLMTHVIKIGGMLVITAVAGIFVFILTQIVPLFQGAKVKELRAFDGVVNDPRGVAQSVAALAVDDWSELPTLIHPDGSLTMIDTRYGAAPKKVVPEWPNGHEISTVAYRQHGQKVVLGTADGHFGVMYLNYRMAFGEGHQQVVSEPKVESFFSLGPAAGRIRDVAYGDGGAVKLAAAITEVEGRLEVHAATLTQKRSLLGKGAIEVGSQFNLTEKIRGTPERILVNMVADAVLVATKEGDVHYFFLQGSEMDLRQTFQPFSGRANLHIAAMDFVIGDVSLVFSNDAGENVIFSLFVPKGGDQRLWGQTKTLRSLNAAPKVFASSLRNKSYLLATRDTASLRHSTTESIRWEQKLPFEVQHAAVAGKHDRLLFLDAGGALHLFDLNDPHPEASWRALFGKLWYEGATEPKFEWQSTGGTDDFEPKLSLVPLIIGTLKGTLYALLFALPIALLAALYTAVFLDLRFKRVVKPVMEIMASLPSVVLGFLAALWLAPLLETRVPSILVIVLAVPAAAWLFGWIWAGLPYEKRRRIKPGYEFLVFAPLFLLVAWLAWNAGPWVEKVLFVVQDPDSGMRVADFRLWWPAVTNTDFQQRNSLVVGFMMGFAVIPIIFTIAEDALSNVPPALTSGSMALGASRWQTAMSIVLPTASAGIFSAVMIGLGRAVGETMIVVMATGNTPIMDLNIFSGMRTLSANIAVELPEAPHHGTLYRTLFLGAMMLFLMTFLVNTVAEILRQRLREKFKTV
jgi:phosphate transport system permease protein